MHFRVQAPLYALQMAITDAYRWFSSIRIWHYLTLHSLGRVVPMKVSPREKIKKKKEKDSAVVKQNTKGTL